MSHVTNALLLLLCLSGCSANAPVTQTSGTPASPAASTVPAGETVTFAVAQSIVQQRCVTCHSATPTRAGFSSPAGGVTFDTPEQIKAKASRIMARAVQNTSMPQGNVTGMTPAERETLRIWIAAGANLQ